MPVRVSEVVVETLGGGGPTGRASEVVAEVLGAGIPTARASEIVIEVLMTNAEISTRARRVMMSFSGD